MKIIIWKLNILFIATVALFGISNNIAFASALEGATCTITAEVIDKWSEIKKALWTAGEASKEYESRYLRIEVVNIKKANFLGSCDFVKKGDVLKLDDGNNPDLIRLGDKMQLGAELASSMGPSGVVNFIHWEPIILIGADRLLPDGFYLSSGDKPEYSNKEIIADVEDTEKDKAQNQEFSVAGLVLIALTVLAIGSAMFLKRVSVKQ
ncbi:MAG: hypothetical protein COV07_03695 [Candidatus Vogelbacteria bacterium CG10_big_fil_rev_8_21_14_0_10_45_14]|uniref:Uncharacterized protein n=1 Tax=Candidatus Vogelbacteria bacterium CG10_big_fil_rev_8_21_14_0_10_45_14 TaxID=1975042 RepID=A0A2H0RJA6_9BACT|nr:MAG: hypothetical protein COV07_03695 [Candidatus Vogelbacteria bacterium CG10_big_fil_rev_8_21_14_0_10_45_14]